MSAESKNFIPSQNENNIEEGDNYTKKELLKLKESLIAEALSKIGFKMEPGNEKGKYNLVFDINNSLTKKQIEILKQNTNTDLFSLLEIKLYKIEIPLTKLVNLAEFINRLINDSNGKNVFLTKNGFGSQSTTFKKFNNTTDFAIKGRVFGDSLIGGVEELNQIIGSGNEDIIINFINKINQNKKLLLDYLKNFEK